MSIEAGRLRHRVKIQSKTETQDSNGDIEISWATVASVWAAIEPLSAREFIAASANQSQVVARIIIRYREDVTALMRIVHSRPGKSDVIYGIAGVLPDMDSGLEWLTLPVTTGVNDGQ